ncbi:hypothetical protein FACS1894208_09210 [Clostridia bacterium]|nr:hypothetical protein FACS1894208_09210 [Clostridia bacterium]
MKTPNTTETAVKYAVENERLKLLAVVKEAKTIDEIKSYLENTLKA